MQDKESKVYNGIEKKEKSSLFSQTINSIENKTLKEQIKIIGNGANIKNSIEAGIKYLEGEPSFESKMKYEVKWHKDYVSKYEKDRGRYAIIAKTVLSVKKANVGVFEKIAESGFLQHVYLHSTGNDSGIITHVGIHNDGNFIRSSFPKSEKF